MITVHDSLYTVEKKNYYIIYPNRSSKQNQKIFSYNSENNKIFLMPKIRTMYIDTPQVATHLLQSSTSHVTPIGKILRKLSLDEIPQLYSVIINDMSLVGPRPALFNQEDLISLRTEIDVHTLKPGITGWAQINGRDNISITAKVALDRQYFENRSFCLDQKILFLTIFKSIFAADIQH